MFDWFEVGTEVLNSWFSHSFREKAHSFPLPFDGWQTEPPGLLCVWIEGYISSTWQFSWHLNPHLQVENDVSLSLSVCATSWTDNPPCWMHQMTGPCEDADMLVVSPLPKSPLGFLLKKFPLFHVSVVEGQDSGGPVFVGILLIPGMGR